MPTNLPPHYFDAEKRYREAKTAPDKIAALEEMLAIMPKHKGTDHLKADLRRRIAKLMQSGGKKAAAQRAAMTVQKEGAAQVPVIGTPNSGKSQLVDVLTNASPTVAEYPFATYTIVPGMMEYENIQIQLLDTPPLVSGSTLALLPPNLVRADALLIVVDLSEDPLSQIEAVTYELGGMRIGIGKSASENDEEELIRHKKKAMIIGNKIDIEGSVENYQVLEELYHEDFPIHAISASRGTGLEELKFSIFQLLEIIRVYTKTPGQKPDMDDPIVLPIGSTLSDAAIEVHKDFAANLKFARIWGSGKHDGVMAKRDHVLQDGDIIELHM
ncbi:MAG: 50S ribosome-binding GTPase [Dehalococcoidales bacterium]|nr:MAG: 50S ribosome-binding GTPase [Dehalococcoidales bacterium]